MPKPLSTDTLIICAGLFVITIVAMMFGSSGLVPSYGFEGKQLRSSPFEGFVDPTAAPYEGFKEAIEYFNSRDKEGFASLNSSDYAGASTAAPKKVNGFDGVQGDSQVEDSGMMGFLGPNAASVDCKSMGYTKSTGNVCFSPSDIKLLTTRGGNAR